LNHPNFDFLTRTERNDLQEAIAAKELEANELNGMNCIARFVIKTSSGSALEFEGNIEDDGACIHLRTPYDKLAKRFVDLSDCVTSVW
jgi:hypothetical protein